MIQSSLQNSVEEPEKEARQSVVHNDTRYNIIPEHEI